MTERGDGFESSRAELFEALGHPIRVRILHSLETKPLGFAELKREVGIESSGHLQFHLGKLAGLVEPTPEGAYTLTDDGREAIRVLKSTRVGSEEIAPVARASSFRRIGWKRPLLAILLIAVVVLAAVAIYQQDQINAMDRTLASDTMSIGGTRYYYESIPLLPNGTSLLFHGVTFTTLRIPFSSYSNPNNFTFAGSVKLTNGTLLNLEGKTVVITLMSSFPTNVSLTPGNFFFYPVGMSIAFPNGGRAADLNFNVTAKYQHAYNEIPTPVYILTYTTWAAPNPWFTQDGNLRVGLFVNATSPEFPLALYVSTSS